VSGNGGWLAKHAFAIYSAEPPRSGFRSESPQQQVDAFPLREALVDWEGPVTLEGYTVAHRNGEPRIAHVACLTDAGARTWATLEEPALLGRMMREEFCGRRGRVDGRGRLEPG
jgi:acetyl-CoA C-acetyltransferase